MTRRIIVFELLLIAASIAATAILYPHLSARVPTHWNLHGEANGFSPRSALWIFGPGALVLLLAFTAALPWLSPRRFEVDTFRSTYSLIMLSMFLLFAYLYGLMLWAGSGLRIDMSHALVGAICIFFAVIGNVLSKVRRNFYIGIRTPWTLANERVWYATHRFAAKCFVLAGLLGLALTIAGVPLGPLVTILVGALAPVVYSLVYYKQLERRGQL